MSTSSFTLSTPTGQELVEAVAREVGPTASAIPPFAPVAPSVDGSARVLSRHFP